MSDETTQLPPNRFVTEQREEDGDYFFVLIDKESGEEIYSDRNLQPEDNRLNRDLRFFVDLMNALAAQIDSQAQRLRLLNALEAAGVDNWDGYEVALEMLRDAEEPPEVD